MPARIIYISIYIAGSAFGLLKMMAVASQLAPSNFGVYTLMAIAAGLLSYINSLGITDAFLTRLNPTCASMTDRKSDRDSGIMFSFTLSLLTTSTAIVVYTRVSDSHESFIILMVALALIVCQNLFNILMVEIQAGEQSITYAAMLTAKSVLPFLIILVAKPGNMLLFFLVLDLVVLIGLIFYALYKSGFPRLMNFKFSRVTSLIREGLAFTVQNAAQNISLNADKWAIGFSLGAAQLGIYAFAAQLITFGTAFAGMIQIYSLPRIVRSHNQGNSSLVTLSTIWRLSIASLAASVLFFASISMIGTQLIPIYYSQYLDSIDLLPLLALVAIVISGNHIEIFFRARRIGNNYLAIQTITLVLLIASYAFLIHLGSSLGIYAMVLAAARLFQMGISFGVSVTIARADDRNKRFD